MANHFRQTAESLRNVAAQAAAPDELQRAEVRHAADILCRLEQLKRDLIASAGTDEAESDSLTHELMSLLGIHAGS